ncbi:MAG: hypothetical protein ACUVV3_03855 [Dehalococcoidia bacterium]
MDLHKNPDSEAVRGKDDLTDLVLDWARVRTQALEGQPVERETQPSPEEQEDLSDQVPDWAREETVASEESAVAITEVHPPPEEQEEPAVETPDSARDGAEALEEESPTSEAKPRGEAKTRQSPTVIVIALAQDTDGRGEAHLFADLEAAGRFIESLIEEGFDQQRLSVFDCTPLSFQLSYRPVVHLKANDSQEEPTIETTT